MVSGSRMGAVGESLPRLGFYGAILVVVVLSGVRVLAGEVTVKLASPGIPITHEAGNGPSSFGVLGAVADQCAPRRRLDSALAAKVWERHYSRSVRDLRAALR